MSAGGINNPVLEWSIYSICNVYTCIIMSILGLHFTYNFTYAYLQYNTRHYLHTYKETIYMGTIIRNNIRWYYN